MDFFDNQAGHGHPTTSLDASEFAKALENRQAFVVPAPSPRMVDAMKRQKFPDAAGFPGGSVVSQPFNSKPSSTPQASGYRAIEPGELQSLLHDSNVLVMDLRSHSQWKRSRIRGALSVTVPSTLLRRPNFSLDKLCTLLPHASDREAFCKWRIASIILVYDNDTSSLTESGNVHSLLAKFQAAANEVKSLCYLKGGILGIVNAGYADLIDTTTSATLEPSTSNNTYLSVQGLAKGAFQQGTQKS